MGNERTDRMTTDLLTVLDGIAAECLRDERDVR